MCPVSGMAWKKVTRRCGSRSDTGVAWGCKWLYEENGVWKETCYCEDKDGCNSASSIKLNKVLAFIVASLLTMIVFTR